MDSTIGGIYIRVLECPQEYYWLVYELSTACSASAAMILIPAALTPFKLVLDIAEAVSFAERGRARGGVGGRKASIPARRRYQ